MLRYLATEPLAFVIVHKVDRLVRNRTDGVEINLAIQRAGARLISRTENIGPTPSGMLLHGIMSSIAEFYSQNSAAEIRQRHRDQDPARRDADGGADRLPQRPPDHRRSRSRTVEVDPNRSEHIRWAFDTYATGDIKHLRGRTAVEVRDMGAGALPDGTSSIRLVERMATSQNPSCSGCPAAATVQVSHSLVPLPRSGVADVGFGWFHGLCI